MVQDMNSGLKLEVVVLIQLNNYSVIKQLIERTAMFTTLTT
jgi:hypothetical protein